MKYERNSKHYQIANSFPNFNAFKQIQSGHQSAETMALDPCNTLVRMAVINRARIIVDPEFL